MAFLASRFTAAKPVVENGETEPLPQVPTAPNPAIADKIARQFLGVSLGDLQKYGESMGALLTELRSALPAIQAQLDEHGVLLAQLASRLDALRGAPPPSANPTTPLATNRTPQS